MQTTTFDVKDMNCTACVMHIESLEDEIEGIEYIDVSYKKQRMIVEYDNTKVTPDMIIKAVKQTGYTAVMKEESK